VQHRRAIPHGGAWNLHEHARLANSTAEANLSPICSPRLHRQSILLCLSFGLSRSGPGRGRMVVPHANSTLGRCLAEPNYQYWVSTPALRLIVLQYFLRVGRRYCMGVENCTTHTLPMNIHMGKGWHTYFLHWVGQKNQMGGFGILFCDRFIPFVSGTTRECAADDRCRSFMFGGHVFIRCRFLSISIILLISLLAGIAGSTEEQNWGTGNTRL